VHRAPGAAADDECRPQLVRDPGRHEQVAVAQAALRPAAGRLLECPDRPAAAGELRERVEVRRQVLAAQQEDPGLPGALGAVDAALDEVPRGVAGHQVRVRIERVPAHRVVGDQAPQPRRQLGEQLLGRDAASGEELDLVVQVVDRPRHVAQYGRRRRADVRNPPDLRDGGRVP
jgi:hypothetical protein